MALRFRPHVKLNTKEQKDEPVKLKFNYGFGEDKNEEDNSTKNYYPLAIAFKSYLGKFQKDIQTRTEQRNIEVPAHIEYINILFQSQFAISEFYQQWLKEFGLLGINFSKFNNEILFAIQDRNKFNDFIKNINNFISKETGENTAVVYSKKVVYIKEFRLLSTADILQFRELGSLMNFRLVNDLPLNKETYQTILNSLIGYIKENGLAYRYTQESNNLEIVNASEDNIMEIVRNFDIVLNVTSSLATVIRPSEFNLPERSYGFEIQSNDNLPIVGIIDTGISDQTPLSNLVVIDESFNLTSTSVFTDNVNHGTAIAALAALGKKAYTQGYQGTIQADARLLSIKVMDSDTSFLSQKAVLDLLLQAKKKYPAIKIFVLTICYQAHKTTNEDYSAYAFELDKFAHENDCLIAICTANNDDAATINNSYDLNYFLTEETNLCTPAESMNNITVGAAADCLRGNRFEGISNSKEFPTLYSRKGHIDLSVVFPKNKINKLYFKPDVIECGGDYEHGQNSSFIGMGSRASMEVLSANPSESFYNHIGTSFSAPLVANVAAQIQKLYPDIKAQSIKALIINGATLDLIRFQRLHEPLLNKTAGHGLVNEQKSVFSNDNTITLLIEEQIEPEEVIIFPIYFPQYLINDDLGKKNGILKVTATLCFSFEPVPNHQLAYCPVHIAFCFFKNQSGDEIQATEDSIKSLLKSNMRWSQSGRHVGKPIPYTNTQKKSFWVNRQDLVNETATFKLAINCRTNPQLLPGTDTAYQKPHNFSLVITIEETLKEQSLTGKLYNEISLCNAVENISIIETDAEASAEAGI
jgi:hypothetical protein